MRRICALALAAAACSGQTIGQAFDLRAPVSMAAFAGYTRYDSFLHTYVAVASMRGDELRVFDPLENRAVSSPGFAFPLSVPTDPRPVLLAAASLNDVDASNQPVPQPDLLVVASVGEQKLQVVDTWEGADPTLGMYVLKDRVDLSQVADPGTEILAMIGLPSFDPGVPQPASGRARILVSFSKPAGGSTAKLVTVEFKRGAGASIDAPNATVGVVSVGFEAVSLARVVENTVVLGALAAPKYPHLVFAATPDIVTGTDGRSATGVAMLDASGSDPSTWKVTAVDAMAPTRLVAVAVVGERNPDDYSNPRLRKFAVPALRAYADLDHAVCGPSGPIACGIATLDPLANPPGLAADIVATARPSTLVPPIVPNQAYRAPISLPGTALAMAVAMPEATSGSQRCEAPGLPDTDYGSPCVGPNQPLVYRSGDGKQPLMLFAPSSGKIWGTAALVVASSTGISYVVDLGHSAAPDDTSLLLSATTRVQATSGVVTVPSGTTFPNPPTDANPVLGLWDSQGTPTDTSTDPTVIDRSIRVTPGFTIDESWTVTWQGALPGFEGRPAVVGRSGGVVYVAFETPLSDGTWFSETKLGDPVAAGPLGIRARDPANPAQQPGDIVEVYDLKGNLVACTDSSGNAVQQSMPVLSFLSPAPLPPQDPASLPGGALSLGPAVPGCVDPGAADGSYYRALVAVRASGLVLRGSHVGYAGRPILDAGGPTGPEPPSALAWEDERPLAAGCAAGDRPTCERLSVARKARRFYYTLESPCSPADAVCIGNRGSVWLADPLAPGPVLAFRIGPNPASAPAANLVRGTTLSFSTISGVAPMARQPIVRSVPTAAIAVDRSIKPLNPNLSAYPDQGSWFYVTHTGGAVLGFGPGMSVGAAVTLQ